MFVLHFLVVLLLFGQVFTSQSNDLEDANDNCNWSGGGTFDAQSYRSITPIYLRCSQGHVRWLRPMGGLQIVLHHPQGFRGCIRVQRPAANQTITKSNIFVEGYEHLVTLYAWNDGENPDLFRCFKTKSGHVNLLIEAFSSSSPLLPSNDSVDFSYDLQNDLDNKQSVFFGESILCQQCSYAKIVKLFCTADFVIVGTMLRFEPKPELKATEVQVRPRLVYRFINDTHYIDRLHTGLTTSILPLSETIGARPLVRMYLHAQCRQPKADLGSEHLFVGRKVLGELYIICALPMTDWRRDHLESYRKSVNNCQQE